MTKGLIDRIPFAKIATTLAVILGISFGLCGMTFFFSRGDYLYGLGIVELLVISACIAGLLLMLLVWFILMIFAKFRQEDSSLSISPRGVNEANKDKRE